MLERLRTIFKESGKSQTEIAKKLNVTSSYIWKILNKDNVSPSVLFIDSVCREFNISEEWLKDGKEPKYKSLEEEIASVVSELLEEKDPMYDVILGIMKTYQKLDSNSKGIIRDFSKDLLENLKKRD